MESVGKKGRIGGRSMAQKRPEHLYQLTVTFEKRTSLEIPNMTELGHLDFQAQKKQELHSNYKARVLGGLVGRSKHRKVGARI